jgi:hypothetical protein
MNWTMIGALAASLAAILTAVLVICILAAPIEHERSESHRSAFGEKSKEGRWFV